MKNPRVSHDPRTTTRVSGGTNFTGGAVPMPKMTGGGIHVTSRLPNGDAKIVSNPGFQASEKGVENLKGTAGPTRGYNRKSSDDFARRG